MKRFDEIAKRGRGGVLFTKSIENDTGKYVKYEDAKKLEKQNEELKSYCIQCPLEYKKMLPELKNLLKGLETIDIGGLDDYSPDRLKKIIEGFQNERIKI